jgi:hypothetical protein
VASTSAALQRLSDVAQDQWGLITRPQALRLARVPPATLSRMTRNGVLEPVARGVYRLVGAPIPDHAELRAEWLRLAPTVPVWERTPAQGVISHRSAASVYGIGDLPADVYEFTLPKPRQTDRTDIRFHDLALAAADSINLRGILVTRPARIAADLIADKEEPEAVARVVNDALQRVYDYPGTVVDSVAPLAARLGFQKGDGAGVLRWLLELADAPNARDLMREAREHAERTTDATISNPRPRSRKPAST